MTLLLAVSLGFAQQKSSTPPVAPAQPADVLIIHDSLPGPIPSGKVCGNTVIDLLGHFHLKGRLVSLEDYHAGDAARHKFIIFLGVDDRRVACPVAVLNDLRSISKPILWIDKHLDELVRDPNFAARLGFRPRQSATAEGYDGVQYKGKALFKSDSALAPLEITDPARAVVLAAATGKKVPEMPYVIRSDSFWYFADSPFAYAVEGDRYWVFADLLHDFLGMPHQEEKKALVRIEDVSVDDNPELLEKIADFFAERKIPFQVGLIPIFKDPAENQEIYLSDRPQFVRAIRYMVSRGATIVLHGVTHQTRGRSADDYEFWNTLSDAPLQSDSAALVEQKLRLGLEECFRNGIYPVTWETPHYMASELDYRTIARYFNSSYERLPAVDHADSGHHFPYPIYDRFGRFIIPECLGYISLEKPDPDLMVANAERLQVVRDGVASFFFHPFMDIDYLEKIVDGIQAAGYRFFSITDYDLKVQIDERLAQTYTDTVQLQLRGHYLHRLLLYPDGRRAAESYSEKPLNALFKDPGVVPPDAVLIMEGVSESAAPAEPKEPTFAERVMAWLRSKWQSQAPASLILAQPRAVILWDDGAQRGDWNSQESYRSALSAYAFQVSTVKWSEIESKMPGPDTILVIPRAAAMKLGARPIERIAAFVKGGGKAVLETGTPLSEALGVRAEKRSIRVREVEELLYGVQATPLINTGQTWNPPADVMRFRLSDSLITHVRDKVSELPLAVLGRLDQGRFLYLAARLDSTTTLGYTRFPYFVNYVLTDFGLKLPMQQPQLELYFDPGQRQGVGIERLADQWRRLGVRAIYAAAYQFWPNWSYDYKHLIDVCHKNGILAYAWFELPHVSTKFWQDHPQWRARTATGEEGLVGWRYHMDLDIPECREAALGFVEDLLRQHPWDGVNIAELNYDSDGGPEKPAKYLPMGDATRAAFKAGAGFDPKMLFQEGSGYYWKENPSALSRFEAYRSKRIEAWHREILERITPLARERDMEIIVTMLDSLHSRTLSRDTGVDSRSIVALMSTFPFTLQVEDPAHFWTDPPDRYHRFAKTYLALVPDKRRLMFDINVVPDRDVDNSHAPSPTAIGMELAQSLLYASQASGRAAIYSEGTIPFEDMEILARVMAHSSSVERQGDAWVTQSERTILLTAPGQWQNFTVDGRIWPGWGDNEVVIPAGRHLVTTTVRRYRLVDATALDLRLQRFTGNLERLVPTARGLEFDYDSDQRAIALFNRQPFEIRVNGELLAEKTAMYYGHWSVRLPRGKNRVEVIADSAAMVIVDAASLYSSSLIVIFGAVAIGLMLLIYMSIIVRRAVTRAVKGPGQGKNPEGA